MNLGELWLWDKKKLPWKIRQESGNPAVDDLRERVAELAGINLTDFLEEGKGTGGGGQTQGGKGKTKQQPKAAGGGFYRNDGDTTPRPKLSKEVLRTLNSAKGILMSVDSQATPPTRNIHKKYLMVPRSLPSKLVMDVQRERWQIVMGGGNDRASSDEEEEEDGDHGVDSHDEGSKMERSGKKKNKRKKNAKAQRSKRQVGNAKGSKLGTQLVGGTGTSAGVRGGQRGLKGSSSALVGAGAHTARDEEPRLTIEYVLDGIDPFVQEAPLVSAEMTGLASLGPVFEVASVPGDVFKMPYQGDLFGTGGTYMEGMVYMSRMPVGGKEGQSRLSKRSGDGPKRSTGTDGSNDTDHGLDSERVTGDSVSSGEGDPQPTNEQIPSQRELEAKIQCASTILAWSTHRDNAQRLAKEGAVEAVLRLCKTDHLILRGYCSAILKQFAATPILREKLVARGGVPVIVDMASQCRKEVVQSNCMVALVNITCINGQEAKMVEDGLVLSMVMIMSEQEDFGRLCATGLFNLTCVSEPYNHIERVLKALVGISSSSSLEVKQSCASAFCNLADLPSMHARLIEEGAVSTIGSIARGASTKTRRICAIALHSLAASKQERTNLVSKGSVPVLYGLSSDEDLTTLHYVACTLVRLGMEEQGHARMIQEGAASALCNIGMSCAAMPMTSLPCALTLDTLSKNAEYKVTIAEEGCIPAIVTLLRSSEDVPTQYHALMTLCSIVMREENHAPILQQGALASILALTAHTNHSVREACALVLFNFSCGSAVQERIVQAGAVPAIIALSAGEGVEVALQRRCAAALCNLACTPANIARMVEEGVIPSIIHLLKTGDIQCVKYCCAALCLVAQDVRNCVLIINEGAIPHMLAGAKDGDMVTKQSCCAVLSTLSSKEECREQLCNCGALPALIQLASMDDEATKLRCVVAFANLSCEYTIRGQMVEGGVVRVLSELSTSYKEKTQLYCARALCNLACHHGSEKSLVEGGGVAALMMIALVRSVSLETKQICAKALLNLVAEDTLPALIEEGIVPAATNLSKLDDEDSMRACATVFALLSADPRGRAKFVQRKSALVSLFGLLRSTDQGTQVICGKAVCNLVSCPDSQLSAVGAGAVPCLRQLAKLGVSEIEASIAMAFLLMSGNSKCRMEVTSTALPTVVYLSRSPNSEARCTCARTLGVLAWHDDSRRALTGVGVARALVGIIEDYSEGDECQKDQLEMCTRALYYLATDQRSAGCMVEAGTIRALSKVMEVGATESVLPLVAAALRCLTQVPTRVETPAKDKDKEKHKDATRMGASGDGDDAEERIATIEEDAPRIAQLVASQGAGALVRRLVEASGSAEAPADSREATLYDCAVVVFNLAGSAASCAELQRDLVGEGGVLPALATLAEVKPARDLVMATMALLSNDPSNREEVIAQGGAELTHMMAGGLDGWASQRPEVITNAVCALFLMSRAPPLARERLKEGGKVTQFLANLSKRGNELQKKVASDALGNLTRDVGMGIEEGTVAALISRSLEGPGDMDTDDDVMRSAYVSPGISTPCIGGHGPGGGSSVENTSYEVQTVTFVKRTSGGGGDLPPPPEPPAIEGQGLSVPAPPHDLKDGYGDEEDGDDPKAMQFAKMDVPEEYMATNDEELVLKMEQRKGGGRNANKELKEGGAARRAGEGLEAGKSGGTASTGDEDRTGCIRFDTESKRKLSTTKRGALKKSMSTSALTNNQRRRSSRQVVGRKTSTAAGKSRSRDNSGTRVLQRSWTRHDAIGVDDDGGGDGGQLRSSASPHQGGLAIDQQAAALGLYA